MLFHALRRWQAHNLQEELADVLVKEDKQGNDDSDDDDENKHREDELTNDIDSQVRRLMEKAVGRQCLLAIEMMNVHIKPFLIHRRTLLNLHS